MPCDWKGWAAAWGANSTPGYILPRKVTLESVNHILVLEADVSQTPRAGASAGGGVALGPRKGMHKRATNGTLATGTAKVSID